MLVLSCRGEERRLKNRELKKGQQPQEGRNKSERVEEIEHFFFLSTVFVAGEINPRGSFSPFVILSSTRAASAQRSALLLAFATNAKMSCAGHRALAAGVATAGIVSSAASPSSSSASATPSPAAGPRRAFVAAAAGFRNNHRLALGGIAALSASLRLAAAQVSWNYAAGDGEEEREELKMMMRER